MPVFKIGEATTYLTVDGRDNSPGKSSLNNTEEQSSSLSEQAWDSYQVNYFIFFVIIPFNVYNIKI